MKISSESNLRKPKLLREFVAKPILTLFAERYSAFWHVARLLGGYESARLVDRCVELLETEAMITNRVHIMLEQLLALLCLEDAGPKNRIRLGYFGVIDSSDPVLEEICLLADELRDAVSASEKRLIWAEQQVAANVAA
jgi:hypothetical protein